MSEPTATEVRVREATPDEVAAVAAAVETLLVELGGRRPSRAEMEAEVQAIVDDPDVGAMLVADGPAASSACSAPAGAGRSTSPAATR